MEMVCVVKRLYRIVLPYEKENKKKNNEKSEKK